MGRLEEIEKFFFGDKLNEDVDEPSWLKDMQIVLREVHRLRGIIKEYLDGEYGLGWERREDLSRGDKKLREALEEE